MSCEGRTGSPRPSPDRPASDSPKATKPVQASGGDGLRGVDACRLSGGGQRGSRRRQSARGRRSDPTASATVENIDTIGAVRPVSRRGALAGQKRGYAAVRKPVIGAQKAGWRRLPQSHIEQPNAGTHMAEDPVRAGISPTRAFPRVTEKRQCARGLLPF